jgi:hypothetical protein
MLLLAEIIQFTNISFTGRAVAKDDVHIPVATAANSFFVVPSTPLG